MSGCVVLAMFGVLASGAVLTGCGAAKKPAVASLKTTSTNRNSAASPTGSRAAFAACLTTHGFAATVGGGGTVQVYGVAVSGSVDPDSSQFQAAMQVCRKDLPGGGPPTLTPAQKATWVAGLARFAGCIRRNGVPSFPGPNGQGRLPLSSLVSEGVFETRAFQDAYAACRGLLPSGPGLPRISLP